MCEYGWMAAIGNNVLFASAAAVPILAVGFLLIAIVSRAQRRAALIAAATLFIPVCIIPVTAIFAFATAMGHQMVCPGLFIHSASAMIAVSALGSAVACPIAGWRWAMRSATSGL